jgi:lipoprotein-releasing system permease protein
MQFELFVSLRYLLARRKQAFISVISLISVLGVAIGVASLIVVLGVMNGFSDNLRDKILGINSHLIVGSVKQTIEGYDRLVAKSMQIDGIEAATPFIYYEVMLSTPSGVKGVVLRGIDPDTAGQVLSVEKDLVNGSLQNLGNPGDTPGIVIGKELAARLGLTMGSRVSLLAPSGKKSAAGFSPKIIFFNVVGIFNSGMFEYDSSLVFVSIPEAQKILGFEGDFVTGIEYRVSDIDAVQQTGELLVRALGGFPLYSRNWIEMNQNLFAALKLEKTAMAVILIMIVLVGSFSIITTHGAWSNAPADPQHLHPARVPHRLPGNQHRVRAGAWHLFAAQEVPVHQAPGRRVLSGSSAGENGTAGHVADRHFGHDPVFSGHALSGAPGGKNASHRGPAL